MTDNKHIKLDEKIKALNSTRVYKKITPMHDLSWYVKWTSSFFIIIGWMLNSINLFPYSVMVQLIGVAGWLWVGFLWHDRALIVLNSIGVAILTMGLLKNFIGA